VDCSTLRIVSGNPSHHRWDECTMTAIQAAVIRYRLPIEWRTLPLRVYPIRHAIEDLVMRRGARFSSELLQLLIDRSD
jgi:hypothetical protein